jgi:hypothetical protein
VRVFNYYLATAGTLVAAVAWADLTDGFHLTAFGLLFAGLAVLGGASVLKLAKLRLAWADSVRTMCQIKQYYTEVCTEVELARAFRWTMETIPPTGKKWTVAFLMAVTIALLSSISGGGAVLFWSLAASGRPCFYASLVTSAVGFAGQLMLWSWLCRD